MSDAVEILLSVDDQASTALQKSAARVNSIDTSAKAAKPHVMQLEKAGRTAGDAIGRIGDTLDVPELGRASSAIGGIAEQLQNAKEASEGMKLGFIGTAGVVGGVFTASVGIGKALGDVVFQTSMWEQKLQSALSISAQLTARQGRLSDQSFGDTLSFMELRGADDQAYLELLKKIQTEATGISRSLSAELRTLDELMDPKWAWLYKNEITIRQASADALQSQLEGLKSQQNAIERLLGVERELTKEREKKARAESEGKFIKQLEDELELITASAEEQDRIIAARNAATIEGQAAIEILLRAKRSAEANVQADVEKREKAKLSTGPRRSLDTFTKLDGFESRLLTRGPQQPGQEEVKELRNILKELKQQTAALQSSSQDMTKLMRERVVVAAPSDTLE